MTYILPASKICPVCGAETGTYYYDRYGEVVGCSECIEIRDAWDAQAAGL